MLIFPMSPSYLLLTGLKRLLEFPALPVTSTKSSYCMCDFHIMRSFRWLHCMWLFFPHSFSNLHLSKEKYVIVWTAKLFTGLTLCQTRANGTAPKQVKPAQNSTDRARGTARMLLRWPSMIVAADQLSCIFYLRTPSPTHTHPHSHISSNHHVLLCSVQAEFNQVIISLLRQGIYIH